MTTPPPEVGYTPEILFAACRAAGNAFGLGEVAATDIAGRVLDAVIGLIRADEREACAELAASLKFRLYLPAKNSPGGGTQALDVVPLTELLAAIAARARQAITKEDERDHAT